MRSWTALFCVCFGMRDHLAPVFLESSFAHQACGLEAQSVACSRSLCVTGDCDYSWQGASGGGWHRSQHCHWEDQARPRPFTLLLRTACVVL